MKKTILPIALLSFFCVIVVVIIWLPVTKVKAEHIAQTVVVNNPNSHIKDYSHPLIEKVKIPKGSKYLVLSNESKTVDIQGKKVWKVTYHTEPDSLLGPIVVYIDYYNGKIYGFEARL